MILADTGPIVAAALTRDRHRRGCVGNALTLSAILGTIGYSARSDRAGRRPVVLAGAVAIIAYADQAAALGAPRGVNHAGRSSRTGPQRRNSQAPHY